MNKGHNSVYVGIVVNTDDPEKKGRVQVYISSLGPSLKCEREGKGSTFRTIGTNYGSLTKEDLKALESQLAWCYTCSPIIGGSSIGRYDKKTGKATVSSTATTTDEFQFDGENSGAKAYGTNFASYGSSQDAFADPSHHFMRSGNYYGKDYFARSYLNAPNGMYSTPALNAKVLVSFINGSKNNGIILGKVPWDIEHQLINKNNNLNGSV